LGSKILHLPFVVQSDFEHSTLFMPYRGVRFNSLAQKLSIQDQNLALFQLFLTEYMCRDILGFTSDLYGNNVLGLAAPSGCQWEFTIHFKPKKEEIPNETPTSLTFVTSVWLTIIDFARLANVYYLTPDSTKDRATDSRTLPNWSPDYNNRMRSALGFKRQSTLTLLTTSDDWPMGIKFIKKLCSHFNVTFVGDVDRQTSLRFYDLSESVRLIFNDDSYLAFENPHLKPPKYWNNQPFDFTNQVPHIKSESPVLRKSQRFCVKFQEPLLKRPKTQQHPLQSTVVGDQPSVIEREEVVTYNSLTININSLIEVINDHNNQYKMSNVVFDFIIDLLRDQVPVNVYIMSSVRYALFCSIIFF
jgi:hypothetical protein